VASSSKTHAKSGSRATTTQEKVEQPARTFSDPADVVDDPGLSTPQKLRALASMEQDARQLAVATAEGMDGGEESKLRNVLEAERTLEARDPDAAFHVVLRTFEGRLRDTLGTETHRLIEIAIDAIKAAREAIARQSEMPAPPPGVPRPGSTEELAEELAKEQLDP
jgi:hypothetical protein